MTATTSVDYCHFFSFPSRPSSNKDCVAKSKRLLDFSTTSLISLMSLRPTGFTNEVDAEMEAYFADHTLDIEPLKFWMERKDSPLYNLALQLHSVPCSSASVERLFSKAGIVLSQR